MASGGGGNGDAAAVNHLTSFVSCIHGRRARRRRSGDGGSGARRSDGGGSVRRSGARGEGMGGEMGLPFSDWAEKSCLFLHSGGEGKTSTICRAAPLPVTAAAAAAAVWLSTSPPALFPTGAASPAYLW
uniref:Uncharacterized protein n=1 Tax=Oryza glaberrima TaxID=4538 RepID=I1P9C2_ORYGL